MGRNPTFRVMTIPLERRVPAYDPFGEPMDCARAATGAKGVGESGGYRETRRAALVFWVLALLFLGGRIYLSDQPAAHGPVAEAGQATVLR